MGADKDADTCAVLKLVADVGWLHLHEVLAEACHELCVQQAVVEDFVAVVLVEVFSCLEDLFLQVHDFLWLCVFLLVTVVLVCLPVLFLMFLTAIVCFLAVVAWVVRIFAANLTGNDLVLIHRTRWNVQLTHLRISDFLMVFIFKISYKNYK